MSRISESERVWRLLGGEGKYPGPGPAPPPAPPTPGPTARKTGKPIPRGEVLSVQRSTGGNFIVRQQIPGLPPGQYRQSIMSEAEVISLGGQIPTTNVTWGQGAGLRWSRADAPTKASEAKEEAQRRAIRQAQEQIGYQIEREEIKESVPPFKNHVFFFNINCKS